MTASQRASARVNKRALKQLQEPNMTTNIGARINGANRLREAFWRTVLTTKDKEKAFALAKEIGDKVRVEDITPKAKRR